MAQPIYLSSLSPREAITDAMVRALVGCDRNDAALFNSAWLNEDASFEINDGEKKVLPNLALIRKVVFDRRRDRTKQQGELRRMED